MAEYEKRGVLWLPPKEEHKDVDFSKLKIITWIGRRVIDEKIVEEV